MNIKWNLNKFLNIAIVLGIIALTFVGLIYIVPIVIVITLIFIAYKFIKNKYTKVKGKKYNKQTVYQSKSENINVDNDKFNIPNQFKDEKVVIDVDYRES